MKLHLNLMGIYFDAIASGDKKEDYRLCTAYWRRLLEGRTYEGIILKRGHPSRTDKKRHLERPWRGVSIKTIVHPHFGPEPVTVFAIKVN